MTKKCINKGKENLDCVLLKSKNPTFMISLECVKCVSEAKQVKQS